MKQGWGIIVVVASPLGGKCPPSAWAIHTVTSVKADAGFRLILLEDGITLAINSLIEIRKFTLTLQRHDEEAVNFRRLERGK
jgi:hypothetical protein